MAANQAKAVFDRLPGAIMFGLRAYGKPSHVRSSRKPKEEAPIVQLKPLIINNAPVLHVACECQSKDLPPYKCAKDIPISDANILRVDYGTKLSKAGRLDTRLWEWTITRKVKLPASDDLSFLLLEFDRPPSMPKEWKPNDYDKMRELSQEVIREIDTYDDTIECLIIYDGTKTYEHLEEFLALCRSGRDRNGQLRDGLARLELRTMAMEKTVEATKPWLTEQLDLHFQQQHDMFMLQAELRAAKDARKPQDDDNGIKRQMAIGRLLE